MLLLCFKHSILSSDNSQIPWVGIRGEEEISLYLAHWLWSEKQHHKDGIASTKKECPGKLSVPPRSAVLVWSQVWCYLRCLLVAHVHYLYSKPSNIAGFDQSRATYCVPISLSWCFILANHDFWAEMSHCLCLHVRLSLIVRLFFFLVHR